MPRYATECPIVQTAATRILLCALPGLAGSIVIIKVKSLAGLEEEKSFAGSSHQHDHCHHHQKVLQVQVINMMNDIIKVSIISIPSNSPLLYIISEIVDPVLVDQ